MEYENEAADDHIAVISEKEQFEVCTGKIKSRTA